jgi:predicted metal-dependent hydrolase
MKGEGASAGDFWSEGVRLFNEGRFFECHEVWEMLWKRSSGADRLFYQGMIQAAAALLHADRGELGGARSIWTKARAKLDRLPREYRGIALGDFRVEVGESIAAAGNPASRQCPKIRYAAAIR